MSPENLDSSDHGLLIERGIRFDTSIDNARTEFGSGLLMAIERADSDITRLSQPHNEDAEDEFSGEFDDGYQERETYRAQLTLEPIPRFPVHSVEEIAYNLELSIARNDALTVQTFGLRVSKRDIRQMAEYMYRWGKGYQHPGYKRFARLQRWWMEEDFHYKKIGRLESRWAGSSDHREVWLDCNGPAPTIAAFERTDTSENSR